MAIERERKFLVYVDLLPEKAKESGYTSLAGYFTKDEVAIRVTSRVDGKQKVCFKGPTSGADGARLEFEYIIPKEDADALLLLAPTFLKKTRYEYGGWEIDAIELPIGDGMFRLLWMAEWEEHPGKEPIPHPLPAWIGQEVTGKPDFSNQQIAWQYGRVRR